MPKAPAVPALTDFKFIASDFSSCNGNPQFPEGRVDGLKRFRQESSHEPEVEGPKMAVFNWAPCFGAFHHSKSGNAGTRRAA